jgi:hypothetical protein
MSRHRKQGWAVPKALPTWVIEYEVWRGGQPYRMGTLRIPAETEQAARQAVEMVLHDFMPNLFPEGEIRLTSALMCESK